MKHLLFFFFLSISIVAFAQDRTIKGRVTDDTGMPLQGVSVIPAGSKTGVQTDKDGNFTISVPGTGNVTLTFSSSGYKTASSITDGTSVVLIQMEKNVTSLDDVVVVGYQSLKRRDLTGSVSSVNARQLKDIPINSAAQALAGRLAGVQVTGTEGSPNAEVLIRVRGGGSITQDPQPIYIIDGVQVENALSVISPQDIESVDVLKDASTTAIYGARGANGVVIITTKKGRNMRPVITYNGLVGIKKLANKLEVMNPYEFVLYQYEASRSSAAARQTFQDDYGRWEDLDLYKSVPPVDWQEEMFGRLAINQTHNVGLSGGDQKTQYNLSLTYNKEDGIMLLSDFDRKLASFKLDHTFSPKLKVGFSTRYNNTIVNGAGTSNAGSSSTNRLRQAIKYKPILTPGQSENDYDADYADQTNANSLRLVNPILLNQAEYRRDNTDIINLTAYIDFAINKYVSIKSTFGYDLTYRQQKSFDDSITSNSKQNSAGLPLASINNVKRFTLNNSNVLTFTMDKSGSSFSKNNKLSVLLGQETYEDKGRLLYVESRYFPLGISPTRAFANMNLGSGPQGQPQPKPTSSESDNKLASFFGRINYSYADRYLLALSFRADGSTKFAPGNRWGYFPSGTFAWRISKEKFMEGLNPAINDLKLRIGYGEAGNNRISDFLYLTTYSPTTQYDLLEQIITAYLPPTLANNLLVWEENISRNIGLDVSFLNNRVQLTADVYKNSSKNLLLNVAVPASSGYTKQVQNVGSLNNSGVEFQINASVIQKKDFTWSANFNASFNKNKIISLGPDQQSFLETSGWAGSNVPSDYIVKVGKSVGAVWGLITDGMYQVADFDFNPTTATYTLKTGIPNNSSIISTTPQPGMIKFKDLNGDNIIDDNDRTIIGHTLPKVVGGLNQQFSYKNFDLSVFLNFQFGNQIYNANKLEFTSGYTVNSNLLSIMNSDKRWVTVNAQGNVVTDPTELTKLNANASIWRPITSAGSFYTHSWAIEDGGFVRLNNVTIGYTLPKSLTAKAKIQNLRVYVTGNNLYVFTNYSGYDPEVNTRRSTQVTPGVDYSAISQEHQPYFWRKPYFIKEKIIEMKKRFSYKLIATVIVVSSVAFGFLSCKKYLDVQPVSSATPDYVFSNIDNAYKAVLGTYACLTGDQGYGIRISMYYPYDNDEMMGQSGATGDNERRDIAHYNAAPGNTQLYNPYSQLYQGIERANLCIYYIPQMELYTNGTETQQKELKRMHGEALTLRAQYYLELIRNWGDVVAQWQPSSFETDLFKSKTDRDSIYDRLLSDLATAETLVPWRTEVTKDERITQGAVRGLRARIALYRAGWSLRTDGQLKQGSNAAQYYQIAKNECNAIMLSGQHNLNPSFQSVFKDYICGHAIEPNGEVVWEVAMAGGNSGLGDSKLGYYNGPRYNNTGNSALVILPTFFYLFDSIDLRRDVTIAPYFINQNFTLAGRSLSSIPDGKFRRDWTTNPSLVTTAAQYMGLNWPLIRYPDVLLMFAEADNELNNGPTAAAYNAINMVRRRGYGKPVNTPDATVDIPPALSKTAFFNAIIKERALELASEGHRKYDLIRWNLLAQKLAETKTQLALMAAAQAPYNALPDTMFYKTGQTTMQWAGSFYQNIVTTAPSGYTAVQWLGTLITSGIITNQFAVNFKTGKSELLPFPSKEIESNRNLKQNPGY